MRAIASGASSPGLVDFPGPGGPGRRSKDAWRLLWACVGPGRFRAIHCERLKSAVLYSRTAVSSPSLVLPVHATSSVPASRSGPQHLAEAPGAWL